MTSTKLVLFLLSGQEKGLNKRVGTTLALADMAGKEIKSRKISGQADILNALAALLGSYGGRRLAPATIAGIAVSPRGGTFSETRGRVLIANILGLALGIPVIGLRKQTRLNTRALLKELGLKPAQTAKGQPVLSEYGFEPNITPSA